jgi:7-carboxy-7-deazaguanine synthase
MDSLHISELFLSLQGETNTVGIPTTFVRLSGCNLRCRYCDTTYAWTRGTLMTLNAIVMQIQNYSVHYVTITGGEPLIQPACITLLNTLCNLNYKVSLETSGALDISHVDTRVSRILDIKTPGSGEVDKNLYSNLAALTAKDQVKLVLCDRQDYEWAKSQINNYQLTSKCEVLLSPATDFLPPRMLAEWILQDRLSVRFQLPLHKLLWGNQPEH